MTLASEFVKQYPLVADAILSTMRSLVMYVQYALLFIQKPARKSTFATCARVQNEIDGECTEGI
jgi:hypothetical protein